MVSSQIKRLAMVAAAALMMNAAVASVPSESSVQEFIKLAKIEENFAESFETSFIAAFNAQALSEIYGKQGEKLTAEQKQQLTEVVNKYGALIARQIANDASVKNWVMTTSKQSIQAIFTQEELDALNAFYRTPIGQEIVSKQHQHARHMATALAKDAPGVTEAQLANPKVVNLVSKMQQEMRKIIK